MKQGPVLTTPKEFENGGFTLKTHQVFSVHTTPKVFENAGLFPRLGLLSTLIHDENGDFRKCSSNQRNLKMSAFRFRVDWKHFENGAFQKKKKKKKTRWHHDNYVISLSEVYSNTNPKWPVIATFFNFSGVVWTENISGVFRVKTPCSNFSCVAWMRGT